MPKQDETPQPVHYYLLDPQWDPWHTDAAGHHQFPRFGPLPGQAADIEQPAQKTLQQTLQQTRDYHTSFDLVRRCRAMLSKPGGGTLLDALAAATPLVFLDSFGQHEADNAKLWQQLGFALPFAKWQATDFDQEPLERCHNKLQQAAQETPDFVPWLIKRLKTANGQRT